MKRPPHTLILFFLLALQVTSAVAEAQNSEQEHAHEPTFFDFVLERELPSLTGLEWINAVRDLDQSPTFLALTQDSKGNTLNMLSSPSNDWKELHVFEEGTSLKFPISDQERIYAFLKQASPNSKTQLLEIMPISGQFEIRILAEIPENLTVISASFFRGSIFILAKPKSTEDPPLFMTIDPRQDSPEWATLEHPPIKSSSELTLIAHSRIIMLVEADQTLPGENILLYDPQKGWMKRQQLQTDLSGSVALPSGDFHMLFMGAAEAPDQIIAYNLITDTWTKMGNLPDSLKPIASGLREDVQGYLMSESQVFRIRAVLQQTNYGWKDHIVLLIFMSIMVGIGVYLSKREKTNNDYFRGGQRIPFWASGLSLFATGASGISLMAMPGRAFETDWAYLSISFFTILVYPIVLYAYVPVARRLKVSTSNEYLERRYNLPLRLFGSVVYSLNQIAARLGAIMLLPAIAISAIAGIPMETSILIMGLITTLYATLGGLEGVIWTDVIQAIVMLAAVFLCSIWALLLIQADPSSIFATIQSEEKLRTFDLSISLLGPTSLVIFANVLATTIGTIGDQNFIQRVQCTPTEKDARKAVLTKLVIAVPLNIVLFSLGTILYLFYREQPQLLNPTLKTDSVFPLFAAQNLPAGLAGLVIAALFAATMSTLSSAINSTANLGVEDFYRRLFRNTSDKRCLLIGKLLTFLLGIIGTFVAIALLRTDLSSVWDLAIMLTGMILAPIAGIFFLGVFTVRTHSIGAIIGGVSAIVATYIIRTHTPIHHFLYLPVGVIFCIIFGYVSSLLIPSHFKDLKGLTAYTIHKEKQD